MNVRLVDVRPRAAYEAGHLPGAVHLDPEHDLSGAGNDPAEGGRHPLPSVEQLAVVFGRAGVDGKTFVLVLDEGTGWAARCWWLLRHAGHDLAGTLDLRHYSGPLVADEPPPAATHFTVRERSGDTITGEEIRSRLGDPALALYDARSPERWRGDSEPLDPVAGRIPGSRNAYFEEPVPEEAATQPELVAYCGSGVTACVLVQQLVLAGRDDVRLYPGSWSEWCRHTKYPIEKGTP